MKKASYFSTSPAMKPRPTIVGENRRIFDPPIPIQKKRNESEWFISRSPSQQVSVSQSKVKVWQTFRRLISSGKSSHLVNERMVPHTFSLLFYRPSGLIRFSIEVSIEFRQSQSHDDDGAELWMTSHEEFWELGMMESKIRKRVRLMLWRCYRCVLWNWRIIDDGWDQPANLDGFAIFFVALLKSLKIDGKMFLLEV